MKSKLIPLLAVSLFLTGCSLPQNRTMNTVSQQATVDSHPTTAGKTSTINKLDLSNQGLTKVPSSVFGQAGLEELDISNNRIGGAIPAEIRQLKNLKVLNASHNLMTGVPAEIGQLQDLQTLDLSNNQLTGLPYELGNLKNLKTLNISGNSYSTQDLDVIMKGLPVGVNVIK